MVLTSRPTSCPAVWLDPYVDNAEWTSSQNTLTDCFNNVDVDVPWLAPKAECCIATVVSPGFTDLLDDMLGSLLSNGGCHDALLLVFAADADEECVRVASKYGAFLIRCTTRSGLSLAIKSVLLTAPQVIDASKFLCLDSDMLVLQELRPIFAALDVLPDGSILACREGDDHTLTLGQALTQVYRGYPTDLESLLGRPVTDERDYPLVINTGIFAGSNVAFLEFDQTIRGWPQSLRWVQERDDIWWREQFLFNLVLAHRRCGVELDLVYNVQLHVFDVDLHWAQGRMEALWRGRKVKVLHFSGIGRNKYPEWRKFFSRVADPLVDSGDGDGYGDFLASLRRWIGRYGLPGLIWSFYGTSDGATGRVRDSAMMPLFALLHYVIRANGCIRVLETGTARGVSAACLASAVAQRPGARVVTFDPYSYDGRTELWAMLPPKMRACIEQRPADSLTGMASALAAGERYEATLLDSLHSVEHVWAEFQLATKLVCPGGLILIHDARFAHGEVPQALERIKDAGYRYVRLWCADAGVCEDDGLGLAVIENSPP
jgi:predicted O-methyltransferase YrrM